MIAKGLDMLQAQTSAKLDPAKVAMVGDTLDTDIQAGDMAGIISVFVTETGVHTLEDLPNYPNIDPTCYSGDVSGLIHDQ
jgi:ribonucleotide monophosphatase NagD (HAD superfamily)